MSTENLKRVMGEIKTILDSNDISGVVFLQDRESVEYLYKLDTTWNCITMEDDRIRIKAQAATGPQIEKDKLRYGAGTVLAYHSFGERLSSDMMQIVQVFTSRGIEITQTLRRK